MIFFVIGVTCTCCSNSDKTYNYQKIFISIEISEHDFIVKYVTFFMWFSIFFQESLRTVVSPQNFMCFTEEKKINSFRRFVSKS